MTSRRALLVGISTALAAGGAAVMTTATARAQTVNAGTVLASPPLAVPRLGPEGTDFYAVMPDGTGRHSFVQQGMYPLSNDLIAAPPGGWGVFFYATQFDGKTISLYGWGQNGEVWTVDYIQGRGWTVPDLLQPTTITGG